MEIKIEPHTLERAMERGITLQEIELTINQGISIEAKYNRQAKYKIFEFKNFRNNKYFVQKKVEVYYIIENNKIITVTVYAFYGKWE